MKKIVSTFIFILIFPLFSSAEARVDQPAEKTDVDLSAIIQAALCWDHPSSIQTQKICLNDDLDPTRLSACVNYTSDSVTEAICLRNKLLSIDFVLNCVFSTNTNISEQLCLLGDQPGLDSIDSVKSAIEEIVGYDVIYISSEEGFVFPEVPRRSIEERLGLDRDKNSGGQDSDHPIQLPIGDGTILKAT